MSLRFVKTSVLSSENGLEYSKEEAIDNDETKMARIEADRASRKTLFEQLEEQKQKKQADYDAVTKQIFAPPKALDDEEFGFLDSLANRKRAEEEQRKIKEEEQLEAFRIAVRGNKPYVLVLP
jgi:predicted patatin/cPLA2 family phospholipase